MPYVEPVRSPLEHEVPAGERGLWGMVRSITFYQWVVLVIASAGWVFDTYENQIFNITSGSLLKELLPAGASLDYYRDLLLAIFLVGGALGGVLFGIVADKWGRGLSMMLTILVYAIFSALTAAAHSIQTVAILRFFVAVGTGGEWAVAAALVAEIFPQRIRAYASGVFHATSILGVYAAAQVGIIVGEHWRIAYLVGLLPALLVLAVRFYVREPDRRRLGNAQGDTGGAAPLETVDLHPARKRRGLMEIWANPRYRRRAVLGLLLASVGLAGYWGVFVAGQPLTERLLLRNGFAPALAASKAKFAYGFVMNFGVGVGLFSMGPLCALVGRRLAFVIMHLGVLVMTPIVCFLPSTYTQMLIVLPIFGFFIVGMHAGYAVYFPELFPARLRATASGLCFNGGRLVASAMLGFSGWLKTKVDPPTAVTMLATIYLFGFVFIALLPETKGRPLEE